MSSSSPTISSGFRFPFPYNLAVAFNDGQTELLFDFAKSSRSNLGDITKAQIFHEKTTGSTYVENEESKVVHVPLPAGLKRFYPAAHGNVGLQFHDEASLKAFNASIGDVGHVQIKEDQGLYRLFLGNKRIPKQEEY